MFLCPPGFLSYSWSIIRQSEGESGRQLSLLLYGPVAIVIVLPPPVRMTPGGGERVASCRQNHFSGGHLARGRAPRIAEPLFQRTLLPTPDPWFRHPAAQGSSEAFENSITIGTLATLECQLTLARAEALPV